ncbi:hypothetical protein MTR67_018046 [Solanum verrucosum]|uniref:Uncharacterized protein n=1 Tax=Solanum verrucosum TaxID=315347 RepID=A0AAF0QJY7_SOLVR|nr:hypothetical protein MTR67_018046 [Solanum verrucosum]
MTNYVGVVPPYYSGILNSLNAYAIFKFAVFLMNEAFFKHGEREALRSCIKALNFWATENLLGITGLHHPQQIEGD